MLRNMGKTFIPSGSCMWKVKGGARHLIRSKYTQTDEQREAVNMMMVQLAQHF